MQKVLVIAGLILVLAGLAWPWLCKIPLGRLPGDMVINKPGMKIYFPVTTMILLSLLLTLIFRIFRK
ncbi:DUF2905 domain-containing protein [bacterium]|nr:DUF2905 domain-containing protein [bacterium]